MLMYIFKLKKEQIISEYCEIKRKFSDLTDSSSRELVINWLEAPKKGEFEDTVELLLEHYSCFVM